MDIKLSTSMLNEWVRATTDENQRVGFFYRNQDRTWEEKPECLLTPKESRELKVAHCYPAAQSPAVVANLMNKKDVNSNEQARQAFLSYVMRECGVQDKEDLPDVVRDAMKLNNWGYTKHDWDVGKGRPLTMRRVRAVMTAIASYKSSTADNAAEWKTFTDWVLKECGQDSMVNLPLGVLAALNVEPSLEGAYIKLSVGDAEKDGYLPKELQQGYDNDETLANWKSGYGRPLTEDVKIAVKEAIREAKAMATWPGGFSKGYGEWKKKPAGHDFWNSLCPGLRKYLTDGWQIENGTVGETPKRTFERLRNLYLSAGNSIARHTFVGHLNDVFSRDEQMGEPLKPLKEYVSAAIAKFNEDMTDDDPFSAALYH